MLKSFYNPDERENLEYHKSLLKMAEQERLANQCLQPKPRRQESLQAKENLLEYFSRLFTFKQNSNPFAMRHHR